jgi:tetratricopeptide (TPR) repeat protein
MATAADTLTLAKQCHQAGDLAQAEQLYRQVLQAEPGRVEALALLALSCHQRNDLAAAEGWYRRTMAIQCSHVAETSFRLGTVLADLNRMDEAGACFQEAVRLRPDAVEAWNNLGNVHLKRNLQEAIRCYREAVRLRPNYADAQINLGNALRDDNRVAEALGAYREAVRLRPDNARWRLNLAVVLFEMGEAREGEASIREFLKAQPGSPTALSTLAANDLYSEADPSCDELRARLADPRITLEESALLHFTLARLLDRTGPHGEAFEHLLEASRLRRELARQAGEAFDADSNSRLVDRLIAWFTPDWFDRYRDSGMDSDEPVFVVGMPRSGTTLVEQILSSHPDVFGVGEVSDLRHVVDRLATPPGAVGQFPGYLSSLDGAGIRRIGEDYLGRVRDRVGRPVRRITDKMLTNFIYAGLIATVFPRARMIDCRRDPLDTCVSCFMQLFRGLNFTLDLEDLGRFYRDYVRLMDHWRRVCPLPILEVTYEELVADIEAGSRRLVEFCGLPWNDSCLRFYENPRAVRTVSKFQVRRPVYSSSVGRWRRYADHLGPLQRALGLDPVCPPK